MAVDIHTATLSPVDHTMNTGLDALFATPSSFSIPDLSDSDILDPSHFFSASIDNGSNNITSSNSSEHLFENFPECGDIPDLSAFYKPGPTNADSHASPLDTQSSAMQGVEAQCFCLLRALSLMKHLFPSPNNNGSFASALYEVDQQQIHPGQQLQSNTPPNIQTVIAKNEQTIEAIHSMLQCSCSQDGYLLTIISLIVFKVLSWYEGAAAPKISSSLDDTISGIHTPNTTHSRKSSHSEMVIQDRPVVGNYHLEGADSDRMAAQLVLGELHRVQRLVNQLSGKLKVQEAQQVAFLGGETSSKNANGNFALPLSSVTLDQIITDLRKRLKALSGNIAESLRS
jgi:Aflatoxin regulatory protein